MREFVLTNRAPLPLTESDAAPPARVEVSETPLAFAPFTAPHMVPLEIAPEPGQEAREKSNMRLTLRPPTVEQLITTTQNAPTLPVIEQNTAEFNDIRALVLAKAENAALRYMQARSRDVERVWKLVVPNTSVEMDAQQFSKLRRRIRGMTIRLARQIMKVADTNGDGHISLDEAQGIAFEQEGIAAGDVAQMFASVDDNNDGELNAPEFADFERIVRARAVETSKKALRVVDTDASNTLTMDEARRIAFEHYGFDENEIDLDGDGLVSLPEAEEKTKREDDMDSQETATLFNIADQNKSGKLDKVELADFIRLVRLSAIRFATDHFKEFDTNRDRLITVDELAQLIENKYHVPFDITRDFFAKIFRFDPVKTRSCTILHRLDGVLDFGRERERRIRPHAVEK
ncbi:EF hand [Teladorsagia circumcincta]|uniref:EF hand n=1 Tax=Teladorsagia circumcincta TaxID=45464 RepID=A0A2G9UTW8_TELCI|nr:EF hand [Teladorsagia circumcincta]